MKVDLEMNFRIRNTIKINVVNAASSLFRILKIKIKLKCQFNQSIDALMFVFEIIFL